MRIARKSLGMVAAGGALFIAGSFSADLLRGPNVQAANIGAPAPVAMNHWTDKQMDKLRDIRSDLGDAGHRLKDMAPDADSHAGKAVEHLNKAIEEIDNEIDEYKHH